MVNPTPTPLLLDVDGVLNAFPIWSGHRPFPPATTGPNTWPEYKIVTVDGFNICYAPALCEALLDIHTTGLAEVRWLTTWAHKANELLCEHFEFPNFDVVAGPDYDAPHWWKLPHAQKALAEAGRLVWCDDDIYADRDAQAWARSTENVLAIIPDHYVGLTPMNIADIREFCVEHKQEMASYVDEAGYA